MSNGKAYISGVKFDLKRMGTKRKNFGAQKVELDGIMFDSRKEAKRYNELKLLQQTGHIRNLKVHTKWEFQLCDDGEFLRYPSTKHGHQGTKITYIDDFSYEIRDTVSEDTRGGAWRFVVEDVKGHDTQVSHIKRGLMQAFHGITVNIV